MIEQAEEVLRRHGFRVCRVRHHETVARLEIGRDEMARALDPAVAQALVSELKAIGYHYVCLDLLGYRTGSLNEILKLRPV
jgi:pyridinium-3,5-biscarboxylic acid mononucleotide sulfurtransferase